MCGRIGQQGLQHEAVQCHGCHDIGSAFGKGRTQPRGASGMAMLNRKHTILDKVRGKFANGEKVRI